MKIYNCYIPFWLEQAFANNEIKRKNDIFDIAEKEFGKMSIEERQMLDSYIEDLLEEEYIYGVNNLIFKK